MEGITANPILFPSACNVLGSQQHDWEELQRKSKLRAVSRYQNVSITLL